MKHGIRPLLNRVIVKPDDIEETTASGIIIPDQVAERHESAQATGTMVAIGPDAYINSRVEVERLIDGGMKLVEVQTERYNPEHTPQVGDRIIFAKFGGIEVQGADGLKYRMLNDRDITAGADADVAYTGIESRKPVGAKQ